MKQAIWDRFCSRFNVFDLAVPLFETDPEGYTPQKFLVALHRLSWRDEIKIADDLVVYRGHLLMAYAACNFHNLLSDFSHNVVNPHSGRIHFLEQDADKQTIGTSVR
jgi:hypothetical protein